MVEHDEVVSLAREKPPRLPKEAELAPAREALLAQGWGRLGIRRILQIQDAIDSP
jgi:hypothetical protein